MTDLVVFLAVSGVSVTALKQFFRRFGPPADHQSYRKYVDYEEFS